jgi:hypothetical protein
VTATAATNGKRQRPATAHNTHTVRSNLGYVRPEKQKVGSAIVLSQLSHRLVAPHRTWAQSSDSGQILTCAFGPRRTHRTSGTGLRIKGKRSCDAGRCQRAVFGIGHDLSQMLTTLEAFWRAGWSSLLGGKVLASDLPSTLPPHRPRPNGAPRPPARARTRKITFELWLRTVGSWTQARQQPPD